MNTAVIKVAFAEDHDALREGMINILNLHPFIQVVADAPNGKLLLEYFSQLESLPDVAILDIGMPVMNGYATAQEIGKKYPSVKTIAYSFYNDEFNIIKMIRCGAVGYLVKGQTSVPDIFKALQEVYTKGYYYSNAVNEEIFEKARQMEIPEFNDKEMQFLSYCCDGLSNKEIAEKMFVSPRTVEYYYTCICNKLGMKSRIVLVAFALKTGIIPLN